MCSPGGGARQGERGYGHKDALRAQHVLQGLMCGEGERKRIAIQSASLILSGGKCAKEILCKHVRIAVKKEQCRLITASTSRAELSLPPGA